MTQGTIKMATVARDGTLLGAAAHVEVGGERRLMLAGAAIPAFEAWSAERVKDEGAMVVPFEMVDERY